MKLNNFINNSEYSLAHFDKKLIDKFATIKKSIKPEIEAYQDNGVPFYCVANLSRFGFSYTDIYLEESQYSTPALQPKKSTILLSKNGSMGIAYKMAQDMEAIGN